LLPVLVIPKKGTPFEIPDIGEHIVIKMKKFFILLLSFLSFNIFSCDKEALKKNVAPSPSNSIPIVQPEREPVSFDSVLLNSFDSKILKEFYKSKQKNHIETTLQFQGRRTKPC
jgi:hypothetical protein